MTGRQRMRVRVSFTVEIPGETRAEVLRAAGRQASCAFENVCERELNKGAVAGVVRVVVKDD